MVIGAILAGGTGSRMKSDGAPKQFMTLGNMPLFAHGTRAFLSSGAIDVLYIGVHPDWISRAEELLGKYFPEDAGKITVVPGGKCRNDTLLNILGTADKKAGFSPEDIIVTHDAARPFATKKMIEENIETVKKTGAANTVVPVKDSIVVSRDGETEEASPDRSCFYRVQTPQSFRAKELKELLESLSEEERRSFTDVCGIYLSAGKTVGLVRGSDINMKITDPEDMILAEAIISSGMNEG